MLAEFGHNYNPVLISAVVFLQVLHADVPDYADAHDLMLTLLDKLRSIDLDDPDTQKAVEEMEAMFETTRRPNPHAPSDG
jgi:hypothetical protein